MNNIPFCTEITILGGVKLPTTVRVFDCRVPDDELFTFVTPWGTKPLGSERAQIALGLLGPGQYDACTPIGASGFGDLRDDTEYARGKLAEIAREFHKYAREYRRAYRDAKARPATDGGSVHYQPIAFALCNYGWSMIADRRAGVTRAFDDSSTPACSGSSS